MRKTFDYEDVLPHFETELETGNIESAVQALMNAAHADKELLDFLLHLGCYTYIMEFVRKQKSTILEEARAGRNNPKLNASGVDRAKRFAKTGYLFFPLTINNRVVFLKDATVAQIRQASDFYITRAKTEMSRGLWLQDVAKKKENNETITEALLATLAKQRGI